jgi:hypothetical protein
MTAMVGGGRVVERLVVLKTCIQATTELKSNSNQVDGKSSASLLPST